MGTNILVRHLLVICFLLVSFIYIIYCDIVRDKDAPLCYGVRCRNGGTLDNETCACLCTDKMIGLFCEAERLTSDWPSGTYGLPLSRYGCPETELHGWRTGYINMTVQDSFQPQSWENNFYSKSLFLMGPFDSHHLQINFCIKDVGPGLNTTWPKGSYCTYRVGGTCAAGFDSGSVTMTGYQFTLSDISGWLPDYSVAESIADIVTTLQLYYCCRNDSQTEEEYFSFADGWPFYVLKNNQDCPYQPGMILTVEYFNFTTGEDGWQQRDAHPELAGYYNESNGDCRNVGMVYCYYSPPENTTWKGEPDIDISEEQRVLPSWKPRIRSVQDGLFDGCEVTEDCKEPNSECRNLQCVCLPGYSIHAGRSACLERCDEYGTTFQRIPKQSIGGYNKQIFTVDTAAGCLQLCISASFICRSVEFEATNRKCKLAVVGLLDVPAKTLSDAYWNSLNDYYHRNCL